MELETVQWCVFLQKISILLQIYSEQKKGMNYFQSALISLSLAKSTQYFCFQSH